MTEGIWVGVLSPGGWHSDEGARPRLRGDALSGQVGTLEEAAADPSRAPSPLLSGVSSWLSPSPQCPWFSPPHPQSLPAPRTPLTQVGVVLGALIRA